MENSKKLKFAIMLNSLSLQKWQYEILENLIASGLADIKLFIFNDVSTEKTQKRKIFNYPWSRFLYRLYRRFLYRPKMTQEVKLDLKKYGVEHIYCKTTLRNKFSEYFYDEDIDSINKYELDFILRFGFNIIKGDILESAKYGVWSFHHGNPEEFRGGPPAFWELYKKKETVGFILQKLTKKLDAGDILFKGEINVTKHSYTETIDRLLHISTLIPLKICNEILNNSNEISILKKKGKIYKYPRNFVFIIFSFKMLANKISFHINQLFKVEKWNVGIINSSPEKFFDNKNQANIEWLEEADKEEYYADPFFLDDKPVFEYFSYKKHKGSIAKLEDDKIQNIIVENHHLSYPFTIKIAGNSFIMPETYANKQLSLYDAETIKIDYTFLKGKEIIDPTLFFYNNIYWLWFSTKDFANENLELWFADSLEQEFQAHPLNPIKVNPVGSRPAGTPFLLEDKLIRPAQNCKSTYGASVIFWEVKKLTKTDYKEDFFNELKPTENSKWNKGLHTFSVNEQNSKIIIDAKRYVFSKANFVNTMKKKLHL